MTGGADVDVGVDTIRTVGHAAHDAEFLMRMAHRCAADWTGKAVGHADCLAIEMTTVAMLLTVPASTQTTAFAVIYADHYTTFSTSLQTGGAALDAAGRTGGQ